MHHLVKTGKRGSHEQTLHDRLALRRSLILAILENTNNKIRASRLFSALPNEELADERPRGKMVPTWYEHAMDSRLSRVFAIRDDPTYGFDLPFIHALEYEHGTVRDQLTYLDAFRDTNTP